MVRFRVSVVVGVALRVDKDGRGTSQLKHELREWCVTAAEWRIEGRWDTTLDVFNLARQNWSIGEY